MDRKKKVAKIVARFLMDESAGDIDERLKNAAEVLDEEARKDEDDLYVEVKEDACRDEAPEDKRDADVDVWDAIDSINSRLDALEAKFHGDGDAEEKKDEAPEDAPLADGDEIDVMEADADGEPDDDDVEIIDTDDVEEKLSARDSAIREISRAVMGIKDSRDRKKIQDAILRVSGKSKSQMAGLMSLVKSNKAKRDKAAAPSVNTDELQSVYDKLNPHKAK